MKVGDVATFKHVYANDKGQFTKPLEEAAELMEAWKRWQKAAGKHSTSASRRKDELLDEIADTIQAACNCAASLGVVDMGPYMRRCKRRNMNRGSY